MKTKRVAYSYAAVGQTRPLREGTKRTMRRWLWVAGVVAGLGCGGDDSPGPTSTRRSCAQLGWVCGLDDYGSSCGSCSSGRACNFGTCVSAGCTPSCGGRTCGPDPLCGLSCGTCAGGQTCSASGTCAAAACTLTVFSMCSVGGAQCCLPVSDGTQTLCSTTTLGLSYCAPRCGSDAYCNALTSTSGTWFCGARGDGIRVCFLR